MIEKERIKSLSAYAQTTAFGKRCLACMKGGVFSNLDNLAKLENNIKIVLEYKKNTKNHTLDKFIQTVQFGLLKEVSEAWQAHFIYALHDEPIDINRVINEDLTIVAQVLLDDKPLNQYSGLYLAHVIEDLRHKGEKDFYYTIKVKYDNGRERYCKDGKQDHVWVAKEKQFAEKFTSYENAYRYIHKRFEHPCYNKNNIYYIYNKDDELVAFYGYNNKETLFIGREERSKIESSTPLAI